jgi:hypothetical protein
MSNLTRDTLTISLTLLVGFPVIATAAGTPGPLWIEMIPVLVVVALLWGDYIVRSQRREREIQALVAEIERKAEVEEARLAEPLCEGCDPAWYRYNGWGAPPDICEFCGRVT